MALFIDKVYDARLYSFLKRTMNFWEKAITPLTAAYLPDLVLRLLFVIAIVVPLLLQVQFLINTMPIIFDWEDLIFPKDLLNWITWWLAQRKEKSLFALINAVGNLQQVSSFSGESFLVTSQLVLGRWRQADGFKSRSILCSKLPATSYQPRAISLRHHCYCVKQ